MAYLGYTLRMSTLFHGWPTMVNDTHTRRRRSNPYTLSILSHGCIITLLVVCCISVASSGFSMISCSEITRFCTRPVQNYTLLKEDPFPSTSENFCEWAVRRSQEFLRICVCFTCLDISVTARNRLAAAYCLHVEMVGGGDGDALLWWKRATTPATRRPLVN